jgi:hypothetical protein
MTDIKGRIENMNKYSILKGRTKKIKGKGRTET